MKNIIITIASSVLLFWMASCSKKAFLDDKTSGALDQTATFSDSVNTLAFLTRIYEDIGFAYNKARWESGANTDQGTDDTEYNLNSPARRGVALATGTTTPANFQITDAYQLPWQDIRRVNLFLQQLPNTPLTKPMQLRVKGEARFMRAYFYTYLIMNFGGVPIIGDNVFDANTTINLPRNTLDSCVKYVVKELDSAALILPNINDPNNVNTNNPNAAGNNQIDYGRVTRGSCMGIKSRLLLYVASPLMNGGAIASATPAQIPLVSYPVYDVAHWQAAADAALAIMNLPGSPYSLYTEPTPTNVHGNDSTPGWGFYQTFLKRVTPATGGQYHQEYLLVVNRPPQREWEALDNPPSRSGNAARLNPSQALVDQFPMRNGKAITDPTSGYNPNNPFFNRDPRFDYTIIYNGSTYFTTTTNKRDTVWTYNGSGQTSDASGTPNLTGSYTGFFSRKMCDANISANSTSNSDRCWGLMRYAEVLLNYAEAINETGQTALAYAPIIQLRQRAGVGIGDPLCGLASGMSQAAMRSIIRAERHVELAFEGDFRWNDMCRWKIATTVMNIGPLKGTGVARVGTTLPRVFTYSIINSVRQLTHVFFEPEYIWPYPLTEIQKMPALIQNPGY